MSEPHHLIPLNRPCFTGKELEYISSALYTGKIAGDGIFTLKCQEFFKKKYHFKKTFLTPSCTDALEMAALLMEIKKGDEIIVPSFTLSSTANPFILREAKIIFADSQKKFPNVSVESIAEKITHKTKAIVVVHYAGIACEMSEIISLAKKNNLFLIEDAAHALDAYYKNKPLGLLGDFAAFSFHETKNITCGEGGMLVLNNKKFMERAEIICQKGTDRIRFLKKEIVKYQWTDIGSSFVISDLTAAFLYGQLMNLKKIQRRRMQFWKMYFDKLSVLHQERKILLPQIHDYVKHNAHIFYIQCHNKKERDALLRHLNKNGICAAFHYSSLHTSSFIRQQYGKISLPQTEQWENTIVRLPLFFQMSEKQLDTVVKEIFRFFQ